MRVIEGQSMQTLNPEFYTPEELAALGNVGKRWVEKQIPKRRLPGMTKWGRYWRFRKSEVDRQLLTGSLLLPNPQGKTRA